MSSNESALLALMQDLGYSHGMIVTAMRILSQSKPALDEVLLYLYDEKPSEDEFVRYIATICANHE